LTQAREHRPAIFLDRDGTLNHEVGYVNHLSRFRLYAYAVDAVRLINRSSYLAVLVTNQAGVARGYFPESLVKEVHQSLVRSLEAGGAHLDGLYYCPHHPSAGQPPYRCDCDCRKPRTGLLKQAAADLGIDLGRSWMVGDRPGDIELAHRAGLRGVMVRSGYGRGELEHHAAGSKHEPAFVAEHVLEAVQRILSLDEGAPA
jgi:D-glycero-D-manno-heptose 1,7-bisphosphate phosphatase